MKAHLLVLFFLFFVLHVTAQYPKLIVQLKDKGHSSYSLNNPAQFLSPRALERRTRFHIAVDSADLPLSPVYIDSIKHAGNVKILSTSKWLNQVLIETTDQNALDRINSFGFVKSAKGVGYRAANTNFIDKFKKLPPPKILPAEARPLEILGNNFNYGNAYNQVHMHEGEFLHNKGFSGQNVDIAVLDAGFYQYKTNTAFDSIRTNRQILGERDFVTSDNSVNEDDTHGMYCLSILSANWPGKLVGTAPKANYWLLRTEKASTEYPVEEHNWVVGAEFADSAGVDIISSSLGYYNFDDSSFNHRYADFYKNATSISIGASIAVRKGMIVCNSAGNEGAEDWKYLVFPADVDSVCAVGAVDPLGNIAAFSSFGYPGKVKPNIVSVGEGTVIAGVDSRPSTGNGTSFSNPNIAGLIACLWQAFPSFNNTKILDAVYKSADRFNNPDNRFGFGIPNFRIAYQLLKHDQNLALYGNEWLFTTPNPFTSEVNIKLIGRTNGPAKVELVNGAGKVLATSSVTTEKEEVYNLTFENLASVPAGIYSVKYSDSATTRTIAIQKGNVFAKDWLVAVPNPFANDLIVYIKAPEEGFFNLRLIDAKGRIMERISSQLTLNETRTIRLNTTTQLAKGIYFLQYISKTQKRTVRLLK